MQHIRCIMLNNCAIRQFTSDGVSVGRCWHYLRDGKTCPIHGDVSDAKAHYEATGTLTDEPCAQRKSTL